MDRVSYTGAKVMLPDGLRMLTAEKEPVVAPSTCKSVLMKMVRKRKKRLQATWGRVQQGKEIEYENFPAQILLRANYLPDVNNGTILEEFEGILDKYEDDVAHVTLKSQDGEMFYGEYPSIELLKKGVKENRRFKCFTVDMGSGVQFRIEAMPDKELTTSREDEIHRWIENAIGDDNTQQDDY